MSLTFLPYTQQLEFAKWLKANGYQHRFDPPLGFFTRSDLLKHGRTQLQMYNEGVWRPVCGAYVSGRGVVNHPFQHTVKRFLREKKEAARSPLQVNVVRYLINQLTRR